MNKIVPTFKILLIQQYQQFFSPNIDVTLLPTIIRHSLEK